jgi:hypothetical protein
MHSNHWEADTTIELVALTLTVPGAVVALVIVWHMLKRRCGNDRGWCYALSALVQ